jgi:DNA-binding MarR family transcriptional regulator
MAKSHRNTVPISILRHLIRAARALERTGIDTASSFGLSGGEMNVIDSLGNTAGLRMSDVARRMLISAPNVTRLVKRLEERGLVRRERSAESDREVIVRLTRRGESLFERTYPAGVSAVTELLDAALTGDEQRTLLGLLRKLGGEDDAEATEQRAEAGSA